MLVTLFGMVMLVREEQPSNAWRPMLVTYPLIAAGISKCPEAPGLQRVIVTLLLLIVYVRSLRSAPRPLHGNTESESRTSIKITN